MRDAKRTTYRLLFACLASLAISEALLQASEHLVDAAGAELHSRAADLTVAGVLNAAGSAVLAAARVSLAFSALLTLAFGLYIWANWAELGRPRQHGLASQSLALLSETLTTLDAELQVRRSETAELEARAKHATHLVAISQEQVQAIRTELDASVRDGGRLGIWLAVAGLVVAVVGTVAGLAAL